MEELIKASVACAKKRFAAFGFNETQTAPLLASGERDLRNELAMLAAILESSPLDVETLNRSLHAVKGLLLNMGNAEAAEMFTELRQQLDDSETIENLKVLLSKE